MMNPKIRFKKSDGSDYQDWEEKNLGSVLQYEQPTKYIVKNDDYTGCSKYPVLTAGKSFILGYTDETEGVYDKGDVIIFDDFTCDSKYVDFKFKVKSSAMKMLTTVKDTDSLKIIHELMIRLNFTPLGHQRHWISTMSEEVITMPIDEEEQAKIANFLSEIDNLIASAEHEVESTKQLKKAMLQKMFPKNGEKVPEIRFPEFTDAWEQRKLGDMGTTFTGLSGKTKDDFGHGDARFVTYMNVFTNPVSDPDRVEAVEIDKSQNAVQYGDVFFTTSSETPEEVGMSSVWLENTDNIYLNSFCFGYRPTEKIDPHYIAYMLRSEAVRKKIIYLAQGISRYNISKNGVMQIEVPVPNINEQRLVGEYFSNLDSLITLHQRKLDAYKKFKKAMMQKMFV